MGHPLLEDLPSLLCFAHVVELGSFTKAAAALGVSKSVVSSKVSALEARLATPLLLRTTRKVTVTAAGATIYGHARELIAAATSATSSASSSASGQLRVTAPFSLAHLFLARPIQRFLAAHPGVKLELLLNDRIVDVVEERVDLAIRITKLSDSGLIARRLAETPIDICGAPSYFAARSVPERPAELIHHNCLRYSLLRADHEWRLYEHGKRLDLRLDGTFQTTNGTMLREAAIAGVGLAILPRFMIHDAVAEGRLQTVLAPFAPRPMGIYAVRSGKRQAPPLVAELIRALEKDLSRQEWAA